MRSSIPMLIVYHFFYKYGRSLIELPKLANLRETILYCSTVCECRSSKNSPQPLHIVRKDEGLRWSTKVSINQCFYSNPGLNIFSSPFPCWVINRTVKLQDGFKVLILDVSVNIQDAIVRRGESVIEVVDLSLKVKEKHFLIFFMVYI